MKMQHHKLTLVLSLMTVKLGYGLDHPPMLKMNKSPADSINIILIYLSALESRGNDDEWM